MFNTIWKEDKLHIQSSNEEEFVIECSIIDGLKYSLSNDCEFKYNLYGVADIDALINDLDNSFGFKDYSLAHVISRWSKITGTMTGYSVFKLGGKINIVSRIIKFIIDAKSCEDRDIEDISWDEIDACVIWCVEHQLKVTEDSDDAQELSHMIKGMSHEQVQDVFNYLDF